MAMVERQYRCRGCGAPVQYEPGTQAFRCSYCGGDQAFDPAAGGVEEQPYAGALAEAVAAEPTLERLTVTCASCGAQCSFPDNVVADRCPFCGAAIVATRVSTRTLRPRALLPFEIGAERARQAFRSWVASLWFAPNVLKRGAREGKLEGVYLPYWTFDARTESRYTGERGTDHTVTQTYTELQGGRSVTRERQVTETTWRPASGRVARDFDDVLVAGTRSLPQDRLDALEPWGLARLEPASDEYLAGYRVESYGVPATDAFAAACRKMKPAIERDVLSDIGGDRQRILSLATEHHDVTFKLVLLPLWLSCYRLGGRSYRFVVNARTGEVQGERPWSWVKLALALLGSLLTLASISYVFFAD